MNDPANAIVWVKRAAEAADAAGRSERAHELRAQARKLAEAMWNLGSAAAASASLELEIEVEVEEGSLPPAAPPPVRERSNRPPPLPPRGAGLKPPPGAWGLPDKAPSQVGPPPMVSAPLASAHASSGPLPPRVSPFPLTSTPTVMGYAAPEVRRPSFNDRLSSVDIEPLSVDSVLPQVVGGALDSGPPSGRSSNPPRSSGAPRLARAAAPMTQTVPSAPPGPESIRRALALIDEEEILAEDEDQRVTSDFGFVAPVLRNSARPTGPAAVQSPSLRPTFLPEGNYPPPAAASGFPPPKPHSTRPPQPVSSSPPGGMPPPSVSPPSAIPLSLQLTTVPPRAPLPTQEGLGPPSLPPPHSVPAPPLQSTPPQVREPFLAAPSSRPPEVARFARRAPPSVAESIGMDLSELTLEVGDLGPNAPVVSRPPVVHSDPAELAVQQKPATTRVDAVPLEELRGFEDLPEEVLNELAASARIEKLDAGEEAGFFGAAVVTAGSVDILPAISDDSGAVAERGEVVFTRGSLPDSIALRVVAKMDGTRVAVWPVDVFEAAIAECPWVHDELRFIADHFIAVCGAALGPLGERLDTSLRTSVFKRLQVKALAPGEELLHAGANIPSLFVLGAGRLEVMAGGTASDPVERELVPGGFVFADCMMSAKPAPASVRAGPGGALVLHAPRGVAHELMMSVPPLLEALASG
jgi:hypothetical protein